MARLAIRTTSTVRRIDALLLKFEQPQQFLHGEANALLAELQARVPVDTGTLKKGLDYVRLYQSGQAAWGIGIGNRNILTSWRRKAPAGTIAHFVEWLKAQNAPRIIEARQARLAQRETRRIQREAARARAKAERLKQKAARAEQRKKRAARLSQRFEQLVVKVATGRGGTRELSKVSGELRRLRIIGVRAQITKSEKIVSRVAPKRLFPIMERIERTLIRQRRRK